jgi:hypothetical protein
MKKNKKEELLKKDHSSVAQDDGHDILNGSKGALELYFPLRHGS